MSRNPTEDAEARAWSKEVRLVARDGAIQDDSDALRERLIEERRLRRERLKEPKMSEEDVERLVDIIDGSLLFEIRSTGTRDAMVLRIADALARVVEFREAT